MVLDCLFAYLGEHKQQQQTGVLVLQVVAGIRELENKYTQIGCREGSVTKHDRDRKEEKKKRVRG